MGAFNCILRNFTFWEKAGWEWKKIPPPCGIFGPKSENEKAYIDFPKELNGKFDIIIIDARLEDIVFRPLKRLLRLRGGGYA